MLFKIITDDILKYYFVYLFKKIRLHISGEAILSNCFELGHSFSYKIACAPSKDSDQSDQSSLAILWVAKDPKCFQADSKDTDQPAHKCRLISVFAVCTSSLVGNAVPELMA